MSALIAVLIALTTTSYYCLKANFSNPIDELKTQCTHESDDVFKAVYPMLFLACITLIACNNNSSSTIKHKTKMKNDSAQYALEEKVIRQRIDDYVTAIRAKDLENVMQIFDPNLVSFDLEAPLQHMGATSKRQNWTKAFTAYQGLLEYEIRDLTLTLSKDLAIGHSVNRISGTLKNGRKTNYWVRWTTCFEKIDGNWFITHDHVSVPIDVVTEKGLLNLVP